MDKRETSSQHRQTPSPLTSAGAVARLSLYCKDTGHRPCGLQCAAGNVNRWPESWAAFPNVDVPVGERIVAEFTPFLLTLIAEQRTKKTVKKSTDYLWVLGGEIIHRTHFEERDRRLSGRALLFKYLHERGGPLWNHAHYEREHGAYDTVCAHLYRLLMGTEP